MTSQERLIEVFVELADTLVDQFDTIDFLHTLAAAVVEVMDATAAGLMLVDQQGHLQVLASSSQEARTLELFELQYDQGPCLDAYRSGQPVVNVHPSTAEERWPTFGAAVRAGNFTTVHAIPLRLRDQTIGAMNLFLSREGDLTDTDLQVARGLADIATIGLLQERSIQHHSTLSRQLQGALDSRVLLEQAKGILAGRHNLPLEHTFEAMRTHARHTGHPLTQVAQGIVDGTVNPTVLLNP